MISLLRRPSAFVPIMMSAVVMALIVVHLTRAGVVREADEGTEAHLFQILMPAQAPIIGFFAATWLRRQPRAAVAVLAIQIAAALAVIGVVFFLHL